MAETKQFWIGGYHTVLSATANPRRKIDKIITSSESKAKDFLDKGIKVELVKKKQIDKLFTNLDFNHQDIAAKIYPLKEPPLKECIKQNNYKKILMLDGLTDQRNIGSIIRSAVAFDIGCIIIKDRLFKDNSPFLYKMSAGAIENINILPVVNLSNAINTLKENSYWIYGLDGKSNKSLQQNNIDNNEKFCLIFGSEEKGISQNLIKKCDDTFKINISNKIESLNVSNAVTAVLAILNIKKNPALI